MYQDHKAINLDNGLHHELPDQSTNVITVVALLPFMSVT